MKPECAALVYGDAACDETEVERGAGYEAFPQ